MDVSFVVIAMMQLPGVLVDVSVNETTPPAAVAEPLPAETLKPVPVEPALRVQTLAELESRVAVMTVELSLITVLPLASWMETVSADVDAVSAAIGLRLRLAPVLVAVPGAEVGTIALQPVTPVPETDTCALPVFVVVVAVTEATPADGEIVCGDPPFSVMRVGVLFVNVRAGELAFVTVLPFASLSVAVNTIVLLPFAMVEVGLAEQLTCVAGPKTLTGAEPVRPSELVAMTVQGCVAEFVAVAAKRPAEVIAPQPPVTDQLMVAPVPAPLAVNCWVPPTASEAEAGERVRPPVVEPGVVLTWKYPWGRSMRPLAMSPTSPLKVAAVPAGVPAGTVKL